MSDLALPVVDTRLIHIPRRLREALFKCLQLILFQASGSFLFRRELSWCLGSAEHASAGRLWSGGTKSVIRCLI